MTIIQPNKNSKLQNFFIGFLTVILAGFIWWGLIVYNAVVDVNHNIKLAEEDIKRAELQNADLKNQIFTFLTPTELELLAKKSGLVKDKGPQYLEAGKEVSWAFASQL